MFNSQRVIPRSTERKVIRRAGSHSIPCNTVNVIGKEVDPERFLTGDVLGKYAITTHFLNFCEPTNFDFID